mgnify:FL=1
MRPALVYLAHPVGAADRAGVEANLAAVRRWLTYLVELPDRVSQQIAWCAPWVPYVEALPDDQPSYRARGMRDTLAALERCDALVAVARLSPGVTAELEHARACGVLALNLTALGALPPPGTSATWWRDRPHADVIDQLRGLMAAVYRRRQAAGETP